MIEVANDQVEITGSGTRAIKGFEQDVGEGQTGQRKGEAIGASRGITR
jgi:hypothetical protein